MARRHYADAYDILMPCCCRYAMLYIAIRRYSCRFRCCCFDIDVIICHYAAAAIFSYMPLPLMLSLFLLVAAIFITFLPMPLFLDYAARRLRHA